MELTGEVWTLYQALYRKYRPRTFEEVVGQEHITQTLRRQVADGTLSHAYLFTGTRGTGKTTCAKILAKAVNCRSPHDGDPCNKCDACVGLDSGAILDVVELDAASNNGVDYIRALREEAVYTPGSVKKRVYIIDEVHMLSASSFNALLKIMEEPPEHLMFILATTELHKVPATIKSRCQQFAFKRILPGDIEGRLAWVAQQEKIDLTPGGAALLARLAEGGMRDALSLLDQCRAGSGTVDEPAIIQALGMMGNVETAKLLGSLAAGDTAAALSALGRLYGAGKDIKTLLGELSALCRDLLIRKTAPQAASSLLTGGYDDATLRGLSEQLTAPRLIQMLTVLQETLAALSASANPRTDAELCFIRLGDESLDGSALGLSARVARLETMMSYPAPVPAAQPAATAKSAAAAKSAPAAQPKQPEKPAPAVQDADEDDAPPPWEAEAPPAPAEQPPAPAVAPASAAAVDDGFWPALLPGLKPLLSPAVWPFVSNPAMTTGALAGDTLTLEAKVSVTKAMIDKPEILDVIAQAAAARLGRSITVSVSAPPPKAGNMEDLFAIGQQLDDGQ